MSCLWVALAVFVQVDVGAGREESPMMRRFLVQAAGCEAADLALWRRSWGSVFVLVVGVEIPSEPRNA